MGLYKNIGMIMISMVLASCGTQRYISVIILSFFFYGCKAQSIKPQNTGAIYNKEELQKDRVNSKKYALCMCLRMNGFMTKDTTKRDDSPYVYFENGIRDVGFYKDLVVFTEKNAKQLGRKKHHTSTGIDKCVDFFYSKKLEDYIIKIENKDYND